jgi:hypothetical protein
MHAVTTPIQYAGTVAEFPFSARFLCRLQLWVAWVLLGIVSGGTAMGEDTPGQGPCGTIAPELEAVAKRLGAFSVGTVSSELEAILGDINQPAWIRGLALLAKTEQALAQQKITDAMTALRQMSTDAKVLAFQREEARRKLGELERIQKGQPPRNAAAYRVSLPQLPEPGLVLHVAPSGNAAGDGSKSKPFNSLTQAQNAMRTRKASSGLPQGGVRVWIGGGDYFNQDTLMFEAGDSGTLEAPVMFQAVPGEVPVFHGGVRLTNWHPVSDVAVRTKLDPTVVGRVLETDLRALGITDFGDPAQLRQQPELFLNGKPQTPARWPNEGFVKTSEVLGKDTFKVYDNTTGCKEGLFRYEGNRPSQWLDEPDVRLYGYWFWDWYEEFQKVAAIDAQERTFTLAKPFSVYGYRRGQRYYAFNVLRELDQPGEWYLDRRRGMLYWLPPEGTDLLKAEIALSVQSQPFISLKNASHVLLLGLTFQEGRGDGLQITGGTNCLVAGCTVRRCGGDGIVVQGGQHHGIFGCLLYTLGCGGTRVDGGNRTTLTPGGHFVENCHIHDISRLKRTYTPAVHLDGVGNRIAHNLFERIPSSAMRIEGNDHLIELNLIRNVVQESDDQGGLDMFGNPLYRGVVIRWNRWSDIRGGTHNGAAGVRLDDMISGVVVHGNVFERCGSVIFGGVQIHGGKENLVDNNLFIDCFAGISFSRWGEKRWLEAVRRFLDAASKPPYVEHYPELANLKTQPDINWISRNVFARSGKVFLRDGKVEQCALNWVTDLSIAPEALSPDTYEKRLPELRNLLLEPIPVGEMGPYAHPWRAATPAN